MVYRAAWVLPIASPPIQDGWISVRHDRVEQVGRGRPPSSALWDGRERDLGRVAVLPGLVNAHTHLELANLSGRVRPASSLPAWVCDMISARGFEPPPPDPIHAALAEARQTGTALLGDVSNSLASFEPLLASPLSAVVFHEVLGFRSDGAAAIVEKAAGAAGALPANDRIRASLAVHAPYSSSPALFQAVGDWLDRQPRRVTTLHLAESPEELRFLRDGTGPWREILEAFRAWDPDWVPPACGPVEYLTRLGFARPDLLIAHGVQLQTDELEHLRAAGATLVTCPRSNQWVGVGAPPVERFYASGIRVAIGTDSPASAPDLNLFTELAELRRLAPAVPPGRLLDSATRHGAAALGFAGELGVIVSGARADLLSVDVSPGLTDVEEYLVSGIQPEQVKWIG